MRLNVEKIKKEIYLQGFSIRKFALTKLGCAPSQMYTMLMNGRCSAFYADCIAIGLGLTIADIVLDEEPKKPDAPKIQVVLDDGAYMPTRAHTFDGGMDLYARSDFVIPAHDGVSHDTGVHIAIPENYVGLITSKSSLMLQYITCRGTIDHGYTGSIKAVLFNHGNDPTYIKKGQKITQLVVVPCMLPELELVGSLEDTERGNGGFGSSGAF